MFAPQSPKGNVSNIVGTTNSDQSTTTKITDNLIDLDQTISNIGEILTDPLGGVSKILGQINDQIHYQNHNQG